MVKKKKVDETEQKLAELTADLQRVQADFENYRKRCEFEKDQARISGKSTTILKLLPVIDNIERAIAHQPARLKENKWAQGVTNLVKNLEKSLENLDLHRIDAKPGTVFDPELHEAIHMEEGDGETEVIAQELQSGYKLGSNVIRHSMVRVTRQ